MDQFNVIHEAARQGLPGEMLLVFTMVLWCIFTLILLADLHNTSQLSLIHILRTPVLFLRQRQWKR